MTICVTLMKKAKSNTSMTNVSYSLTISVKHRLIFGIVQDFVKGIPRLANLLDSNENFSIFRRFGPYAARCLVHRQIELGILVKRLDKLDREDALDETKHYRLHSAEHRDDWDETQKKLIDEIEMKLWEYCTSNSTSGYEEHHTTFQLTLCRWVSNEIYGGPSPWPAYKTRPPKRSPVDI
jgi:hypothetical protein